MKWRAVSWLGAWALLSLPVMAGAKVCGDDVGGRDVPCACGDVVVSGVVLGDDPVTAGPCPGGGLIVQASDARRGVTIDLHGRTLAGSGRGIGLWILGGGRGGARVVSSGGPATIENFGDGIVGFGDAAVALIEGVTTVGARRDGVRVRGSGFTIRDTEARGSGRYGFALAGRDFALRGTQAADSGRTGYDVEGRDATLEGIVAERSGRHGVRLTGAGHRLTDCVAAASGDDGVRLSGRDLDVRRCEARDNGGAGIAGRGRRGVVAGNRARDNRKGGIAVAGNDVEDGGDNVVVGRSRERVGRPVLDCEIGGAPCLP